MRILHIGDIVGSPGRQILEQALPNLRQRESIDFVIANGENCAGGTGITPENYKQLIACGVDCISLGDHIYRRRQITSILEREKNIVKPANYPKGSPGRGWAVRETAGGTPVAVLSLQGRVFMKPIDCPFAAADRALAEITQAAPDVKIICVDFHAEATSDKQLMGRHLDGRVTSVLGTHTHVTTADEQIFPGGTAFQCDIGMTGPHLSIIGRRIDRVLQTTTTFYPTPFDVAEGDPRLSATLVEADPKTGQATAIRRIRVDDAEAIELKLGRFEDGRSVSR
jgi:metallophosphoesterase (TIGR00282 family)